MSGSTVPMTRRGAERWALLVAMALIAVVPQGVRAEDDLERIQAEAGQYWYQKYCTPCHGVGGVPGSATYPDTKTPVDLRDYVKRHDGKFPAAQWISIVTTDNPAQVHTEVWHKIRDAQGGVSFSNAAGKAVVASIASYVRSIQR